MKTQLTAEESAKLLELGVSYERASGRTFDPKDVNNLSKPIERRELFHVFKLADIIDILPKEIDYNGLTYGLHMWVYKAVWYVAYVPEAGRYDDREDGGDFESPELIDALYSLLVWCLEEGYVK